MLRYTYVDYEHCVYYGLIKAKQLRFFECTVIQVKPVDVKIPITWIFTKLHGIWNFLTSITLVVIHMEVPLYLTFRW